MTAEEEWGADLKKQVIDENDKVLFSEAMGCFLSGHYRASYITSWISLIESLKRKISAFSNLGDSRSNTAFQKIEEAENQKLSVDKLIFEEAKNCGIIDNADFSKINFLWEQRCLFAHPYNLRPESDEVKYIISQTVRISLGKELYYNKAFLTELSENLANKPFFLPSDIEQVRNYANRTIARTPENLHPFFFKTLLFKVGEIYQSEDKFYELRKLRYFLVELFLKTSIPLENSDWSLENRVTNYPHECFVGFVHEDTWKKLPIRIKEMLIAYVESENDKQRLLDLKSITSYLVKNDVLEEIYSNRYFKKLNSLSFDSAIHFYGKPKEKFKRIWENLTKYQFDEQNPVIDYIKTDRGIALINGLDKTKQYNLGRLLKSCASNNHWKTQNLISSIYGGNYEFSHWLKAGIIMGSFMSMKNKFYFDEKTYEQSIVMLNALPQNVQNEVYDNIESTLEAGQVDEWDKMMFDEAKFISITDKTIEAISDWSVSSKERLEKLRDKVKTYYD